jgi:hypothetical protein
MGNKAERSGIPVVYFLKVADRDVFKIGFTLHSPLARVRAIRAASPDEIELWAVLPTNAPVELERQLHSIFAPERMRGEWFALTPERLLAFFEQHKMKPLFRHALAPSELTPQQATRLLTATAGSDAQLLRFQEVGQIAGVPYKQITKILRRSIPTYEQGRWRTVRVSELREWAEGQRGNVNITEDTAKRAVELLET